MKGGRNRRGEKKGLKAKGDIKDGGKDKGVGGRESDITGCTFVHRPKVFKA